MHPEGGCASAIDTAGEIPAVRAPTVFSVSTVVILDCRLSALDERVDTVASVARELSTATRLAMYRKGSPPDDHCRERTANYLSAKRESVVVGQ